MICHCEPFAFALDRLQEVIFPLIFLKVLLPISIGNKVTLSGTCLVQKGFSRFSEATVYLMPVQEEQGEDNQSE